MPINAGSDSDDIIVDYDILGVSKEDRKKKKMPEEERRDDCEDAGTRPSEDKDKESILGWSLSN